MLLSVENRMPFKVPNEKNVFVSLVLTKSLLSSLLRLLKNISCVCQRGSLFLKVVKCVRKGIGLKNADR